jgi:uncharacterized protein (UPF0218 family)
MSGRRVPEDKRNIFKEPIGSELKESELIKHHDTKMITVGDVVSLTVRNNGIRPILSVYDGYTERREMTEFAALVEGEEKVSVINPAGTITDELDDAVRNALTTGDTDLIRVEGEEDLALMPCILHAPEGAEIVYGWPGKGMMIVSTDDVTRKRVEELWKMMEDFE